MFNYWQWLMSHHRQNHSLPRVESSSDENASWIVVRHGWEIWWGFSLEWTNFESYKSAFKCICEKWQLLSCCKWAYSCSSYPFSWTQTRTYRHTAAYPYGSFHFCSKRQLNIPELNCSLHGHLSTGSPTTHPPPYTWILHSSSKRQYKYFK